MNLNLSVELLSVDNSAERTVEKMGTYLNHGSYLPV
jgi:hypothetical protein